MQLLRQMEFQRGFLLQAAALFRFEFCLKSLRYLDVGEQKALIFVLDLL